MSSFYKGSLITYAAEEKIRFANVKKETIDKYSVVSPEVALEMAQGGKASLNVDVCLSITGNAGPSVDKGNKEVGEIYIGLAFDDKSIFKKINLKGDRNDIRSMSIKEMIRYAIDNVPSSATESFAQFHYIKNDVIKEETALLFKYYNGSLKTFQI